MTGIGTQVKLLSVSILQAGGIPSPLSWGEKPFRLQTPRLTLSMERALPMVLEQWNNRIWIDETYITRREIVADVGREWESQLIKLGATITEMHKLARQFNMENKAEMLVDLEENMEEVINNVSRLGELFIRSNHLLGLTTERLDNGNEDESRSSGEVGSVDRGGPKPEIGGGANGQDVDCGPEGTEPDGNTR